MVYPNPTSTDYCPTCMLGEYPPPPGQIRNDLSEERKQRVVQVLDLASNHFDLGDDDGPFRYSIDTKDTLSLDGKIRKDDWDELLQLKTDVRDYIYLCTERPELSTPTLAQRMLLVQLSTSIEWEHARREQYLWNWHFDRREPQPEPGKAQYPLGDVPLMPVMLNSLADDKQECPICGEPYGTSEEEILPENPVSLPAPCPHVFGHLCIKEWLNNNNTCPLCRHSFGPDNEDEGHQPWESPDREEYGIEFGEPRALTPWWLEMLIVDRRRWLPLPGSDRIRYRRSSKTTIKNL